MIFKNRRVEVRFVKEPNTDVQDEHIHYVDRKGADRSMNVDIIVSGAQTLIRTYFVWKMAEKAVTKILH